MLDLAILGLLKERSMHGYELKKQLGQRLGFFWTVSFGSLYPTLKKLERQGWVVKSVPAEHTPRRKQVYQITDSGEQRFFALLEEGPSSAWEDEKFSLRLAFFRYLRPETRIRLLERRKQTLEERLREGERSLSNAKRGPTDTYTLSLMRHGMAVTQADITWLDGLVTAERAALDQAPPRMPEEAGEAQGVEGAPPAGGGPATLEEPTTVDHPQREPDDPRNDIGHSTIPGDKSEKGAS